MFRQSSTQQLAALACALLLCAPLAHAAQGTVAGETLTSSAFPVGSIRVDPKFNYVGTTEFVLYNVANCEIHVFAELDGKQVKRFYWIQFEGYLPDNRQTYNYTRDPQRTMIGGHAFHERASFSNIDEARAKSRAGSDSAAVRKMLEDKGYVAGPDIMNLRLVRLDESGRKELMIIYSENLATHGLRAVDVAEGGNAFAQREALIDGLRQRAVDGLRMTMK